MNTNGFGRIVSGIKYVGHERAHSVLARAFILASIAVALVFSLFHLLLATFPIVAASVPLSSQFAATDSALSIVLFHWYEFQHTWIPMILSIGSLIGSVALFLDSQIGRRICLLILTGVAGVVGFALEAVAKLPG